MSNPSKRVVGGQKGESSREFSHPFLQPEVKSLEPKAEDSHMIRILPAFAMDKDDVPLGGTTFIPYRYAPEGTQEHGAFTPWYYEFLGYKFLGPNGGKFLSPATHYKSQQFPQGVDPVIDLYRAIKNGGDPELARLIDKDGAKTKQDRARLLQWPRSFYLMNILDWNATAQVWENKVIVLTQSAMVNLQEKLNRRAIKGCAVVTPGFEDYLFGDPTDPYTGLQAVTKKFVFNSADMSTVGVFFGGADDRHVNIQPMAIDPEADWGQAFLNGRYDLGDIEKVVRIASREEILESLVSGNFIPAQFLRDTLEPMGYDVSGIRTTPVYSPPPQASRHVAPSTGPALGGNSGAPRPPGPPAPAGAKPAAPSAAPAAPRPAGPTAPAAPRPAGPAAPGAPRPTAPTAPAAPAAPRPAGGPPRPTAPVQPAPAAPAAPQDDVPMGGATPLAPLSEAEVARLNELENKLQQHQESVTDDEMNEMAALGDRRDIR